MSVVEIRARILAIDRRVDELALEIEVNKNSSMINEAIQLLFEKERLLRELSSNDA